MDNVKIIKVLILISAIGSFLGGFLIAAFNYWAFKDMLTSELYLIYITIPVLVMTIISIGLIVLYVYIAKRANKEVR